MVKTIMSLLLKSQSVIVLYNLLSCYQKAVFAYMGRKTKRFYNDEGETVKVVCL